MLIKELHPSLRNLAVRRTLNSNEYIYVFDKYKRKSILEKELSSAFTWVDTPEGWNFWLKADSNSSMKYVKYLRIHKRNDYYGKKQKRVNRFRKFNRKNK